MRSPKSPPIMASGNSTNILPESPNELCNRLEILLQEKKLELNLI